jgi:type VI secretion system secreted protein Hcp
MATDFFLKIEGIDGESTDDKHKGQIDLLSYSFGAAQSGSGHTGGGLGVGKVALNDFHCTTHVSKASPKLFLACATGEHLKSVTLICRRAGKEQVEYMNVKLSDVLVSAYTAGASAHSNELPVDQVAFNFSKIEVEYKEQKADGTAGGAVKAGWDVKANKKV